jgi:hypothetical protein
MVPCAAEALAEARNKGDSMRTETIVKAVTLVLMFSIPLGCGSSASGSSSTSAAGSTGAGAGSIGGGTSTGTVAAATGTGGVASTGAATSGGSGTGGGLAGLGDSCTYKVSTGVDTCTQFGLECTSTISWVFCEGLDYPCPPDASNCGRRRDLRAP